MNIALIGAPSSGKSELATRLKDEIGECCCGIVDNYIVEIEAETNIALGPIADYIGNFYVALGRYARERIARSHNSSTISCGTLIETAVYVALNIVATAEVITEEEKEIKAPVVDATMRMMSCLYNDIFGYDRVYYLPSRVENMAFFDHHIQAALEGFKLVEATVLEDNDLEVRVQKVMDEVRA